MDDDNAPKTTLKEFLDTYADAERIPQNITGFIVRAKTFPPLRGYLLDHSLDVEGVLLSPPEQQPAELARLLSSARQELGKPAPATQELPQFQQSRTPEINPLSAVSDPGPIGKNDKKALDALPQVLRETGLLEKRRRLTDERVAAARRIAQDYTKNVNAARREALAQQLAIEIESELKKPLVAQTVSAARQETAERIRGAALRVEPGLIAPDHIIPPQDAGLVTGLFVQQTHERALARAALAYPDTDLPVVTKTIDARFAASPNIDADDAALEGVMAGRAAAIFASPNPGSRPINISFEKLASGPLASTADFLLKFAPQNVRDAAIKGAFASSFNRVIKNTDLLQRELGVRVSDATIAALRSQGGAFFNESGAKSGQGALLDAISSVGGFVFGGAPDETMVQYMQEWHRQALAGKPPPDFSHFYLVAQMVLYAPGQWGQEKLALLKQRPPQAGGNILSIVFGSVLNKGVSPLLTKIGLGAAGPAGWIASAVSFVVEGKIAQFASRLFQSPPEEAIPILFGITASSLVLYAALFLALAVPLSTLLCSVGVNITGQCQTQFMQTLFSTSLKAGGDTTDIGPGASLNTSGVSGPACMNLEAPGIDPDYPTHTPTDAERTRIENVVKAYPQLGCFASVLGCPARKINFTVYDVNLANNFFGFAPGGNFAGNIVLYPRALDPGSFTDWSLARLIAHEFGHEIMYLHREIYDEWNNGSTTQPAANCGALGTYVKGVAESSEETFAEAVAMYLIGHVETLRVKCPSSYNFMARLFASCH